MNSCIKHLQKMEVAARLAKSPSMPVAYIIATKYTDKTANGLTKCIIEWLRYNNWQGERISNTGRLVSNHWIPGTGTNGTADISAVIRGRAVKIEVKIGKDRQSDKQIAYQQSIELAGGVYIIAKDFESFYNWYHEFLKKVA